MITLSQFEHGLEQKMKGNLVEIDQTNLHRYPYCSLLRLLSVNLQQEQDVATLAMMVFSRKQLRSSLLGKEVTNKMTSSFVKPTTTVAVESPTCPINSTLTESKASPTSTKNSDAALEDVLKQRLNELKLDSLSGASFEKEEEIAVDVQSSISLDELIEKFNTMPPRKPLNPEDIDEEIVYKDLAKSSILERTNIVSETLADLYYSQGAYSQALKIYEAIVLKNPEKSVTFADRIQELKNKKNRK